MKGLLKSLEAVIGIIAILSVYLFLFTGEDVLPDVETTNWKIIAMNSLISLDQSNQLRVDALENNTARINSKLDNYIPELLDHSIFVCIQDCGVPYVAATRIVSVSYLIAGMPNNVTNRQIVLHVWSND